MTQKRFLYSSNFDAAFKDLEEYKRNHGTANVKKREGDMDLYNWSQSTKGRKEDGKLLEEYVDRLDKIGFSWRETRIPKDVEPPQETSVPAPILETSSSSSDGSSSSSSSSSSSGDSFPSASSETSSSSTDDDRDEPMHRDDDQVIDLTSEGTLLVTEDRAVKEGIKIIAIRRMEEGERKKPTEEETKKVIAAQKILRDRQKTLIEEENKKSLAARKIKEDEKKKITEEENKKSLAARKMKEDEIKKLIQEETRKGLAARKVEEEKRKKLTEEENENSIAAKDTEEDRKKKELAEKDHGFNLGDLFDAMDVEKALRGKKNKKREEEEENNNSLAAKEIEEKKKDLTDEQNRQKRLREKEYEVHIEDLIAEETSRGTKRRIEDPEDEGEEKKRKKAESYANRQTFQRDGREFKTVHDWLAKIADSGFIEDEKSGVCGRKRTEFKISKKVMRDRFFQDTKFILPSVSFGMILKIIYPDVGSGKMSKKVWNKAPCYVIDIPTLKRRLRESPEERESEEQRLERLQSGVMTMRETAIGLFRNLIVMENELGIEPAYTLYDRNAPKGK